MKIFDGPRTWRLSPRLLGFTTAGVLLLLFGAGGCDSNEPMETAKEFQKTPSGLKYRIRREGSGPYPKPDQLLRLHFTGWLDDGTVFENTYESGEPTAMFVNKTIPGWQEGLLLCRQGGAIELEVPPELGYGAEGNSIIPPHSTLHFLIEIEQILD